MNNPAFYPKAAFKIKLPAEAPHAAARRGNMMPAMHCFVRILCVLASRIPVAAYRLPAL